MGTIRKGILGGFSGKTGNVVGGSWKGIAYMRAVAKSVKNPQTPRQLSQRTRLKTVTDLLKQMSELISIGFRDNTARMTAFNAAVRYNIRHVSVDALGTPTVDYPKLAFSFGDLTGVSSPSTEYDFSFLGITWTDNTGDGSASADDKPVAVFVNTDNGQAFSMWRAGCVRSEGYVGTDMPSGWSGCHVACYLAFMTADESRISDSIYVDTILTPTDW